jgi:integrase
MRHVVPMATIVERKRKDGTSAFMVQITLKRGGRIAHREAKTFDTRREAQSWVKWREAELEAPGALDKKEDPILSDVILQYERESKRLGRTKANVLRNLRGTTLAAKRCSEIRSEHIVSLARELAQTRGPATVAGYMTFLSGVFEVAKPAWGYPLDLQAMKDASVVTSRMGITGRSNQRDRRPTVDEMDRLMQFFSGRKVGSLPMASISAFALFSARREGEIVRLRWEDLDETHSRILVRDAKDPRGAEGNHIWCELPAEALDIIKATPRTGEFIFPFKGDTINFGWRDACRLLGIDNLKFHDLRHEAISRLFEMGRTIPQVASVSGHRSWQNLQRYTHLRQTGDKWAGWKWMEVIAPKPK